MFFNLLNRKTFDTEKELILYVIENSDKSYSEIYKKYAKREWKSNPKYHKHGCSPEYTYDAWIMEFFSNNSDDLEIIEALWKKYKYGNLCWTKPIFETPFVKNVNLTDDLIRSVYSYYSTMNTRTMNTRIQEMQKVEYKNILKETKEVIDNHYSALQKKERKEKEDKTKKKLTAFLTTAAATKSVLTGNSIDDVVEQTITSDIDDAVLNYMNKLFDKK
tara:strand:+ start:85 stop:738 length:654 start_codon:yes stop_codon:yes gene_type:complete